MTLGDGGPKGHGHADIIDAFEPGRREVDGREGHRVLGSGADRIRSAGLPLGGKVYVAQARGPDGPKRVTVGRHWVIGAEQARQRAALVIARVKAGEPPVPEPLAAKQRVGPTVGELAERLLEEYAAVRYRPATLAWTRTAVQYIVPEFGKLALAAVERTQVRELHHRLSHTPSTANMVIRTLSLMYRLAEDWGLVSEGCNPCHSVVKYPQRKRARFLTDEEFTRLGQILDEVETQGGAPAPAVAAICLLMLTGCRKSEILTLRWEHVGLDAGELRPPDSKTGARVISLPPMVLATNGGETACRPLSRPGQSEGDSRTVSGHPSSRTR